MPRLVIEEGEISSVKRKLIRYQWFRYDGNYTDSDAVRLQLVAMDVDVQSNRDGSVDGWYYTWKFLPSGIKTRVYTLTRLPPLPLREKYD